MNVKLVGVFIAGLGLGSVAGAFATRRHYMLEADELVREEIDSIREHLLTPDIDEVVAEKISTDEGYFSDSEDDVVDVSMELEATIITESEYYSENDYRKLAFTYWRDDHVMEADDGTPVEPPWVFNAFDLEMFETEGMVYIRSASTLTDYEFTCTSEHDSPEDE